MSGFPRWIRSSPGADPLLRSLNGLGSLLAVAPGGNSEPRVGEDAKPATGRENDSTDSRAGFAGVVVRSAVPPVQRLVSASEDGI